MAKYQKKGSSLYIEGRLQTRSWDEKGQKRYSTDIVADLVNFLGPQPLREESPPASGRGGSRKPIKPVGEFGSGNLGDIPY